MSASLVCVKFLMVMPSRTPRVRSLSLFSQVCGFDGLLLCCEACPQAYHAACLGEHAPPEDDDSAWFCPPCAMQLGMA